MGTELNERRKNAVWGALVADAASVGLHWIYDQAHILKLAPDAPEFRPPSEADYAGVSSYFAHEKCLSGDLSHYGEQALTLLRALGSHKKYDKAHYEKMFVEYFSEQGAFTGYVDGATQKTLKNVSQGLADTDGFHGSDDVQLPALSKLPPLVALYAGKDELAAFAESAVRVTNNNEPSITFGQAASAVIESAILSGDISSVLEAGTQSASQKIQPLIEQALEQKDKTVSEATASFALNCNLVAGFPSVIHNVATATSFQQAVRDNIYAGGDSCGRALFLGAVLGATYGIGGDKGIPQAWIDTLRTKEEVAALLGELIDCQLSVINCQFY